jgi:anaerobic ribonucleoside-triphosphate reductase activating protein
MIKYVDYDIVFQEVPGEVSLALNISGCPFRCEGCHSPHLREDIGRSVQEDLPHLLEKYKGMVTCVLFLGTGNDYDSFCKCMHCCRVHGVKTAVYTGADDEEIHQHVSLRSIFAAAFEYPDYLKTGQYKKELGGLSSPSTNQRMYRMNSEGIYDDITYMFWKKEQKNG